MAKRSPRAISEAQRLAREKRVIHIAREFGFVGQVSIALSTVRPVVRNMVVGAHPKRICWLSMQKRLSAMPTPTISHWKRWSLMNVVINSWLDILASQSGWPGYQRRVKKYWPP